MRVGLMLTLLIVLVLPIGALAFTKADTALPIIPGPAAGATAAGFAVAAPDKSRQEADVRDASALGPDFRQVLSAVQNVFSRDPAALFIVGALLLMLATSLRLKVTRNLQR